MIEILQAQRRGPRTEPETFVAEESLMSAPIDFAVQYVEEALYTALEDEWAFVVVDNVENKWVFNAHVQVCLLLWSRIDSYYRPADGLRQEQLKNWMTGQVTKRIHNARAQRNRQPKPKQTSVATQT